MLHYINKDGYNILVSGKYLTLNGIDEKAGQYISKLSVKENCELEDIVASHKKIVLPKKKNIMNDRVDKIVFIISDKCNMNCTYCYEKQFDLSENQKGFMTFDVAKKAVDVLFDKYKNGINMIQFFGGEPLLNFKVVQQVVLYIIDLCENLKIQKPMFVMSTNGTLLNEQNSMFIKDYFTSVTISIDGIKEINDINRRFKENSKRSVFDTVINNLKLLKTDEKSIWVNLETTLTAQNYSYMVQHKISGKEYVDYLYTLGVDDVHIKPVIAFKNEKYSLEKVNEETLISLFDQIYAELIVRRNNLVNTDIANSFINGTYNEHYCHAGIDSYSIGTTGNIYPCFMFDEDNDYLMGSINENIKSKKYCEVEKQFYSNIIENNNKCVDCWANKLCESSCAACVGSFKLYHNEVDKVIDINCKIGKTMIERYIVELYKLVRGKHESKVLL